MDKLQSSKTAYFQHCFSEYLLHQDDNAGIENDLWESSQEDLRIQAGLSVYRNNVMYSLTEALAAQFPAVNAITGENFFRALSREYVEQFPPENPALTFYGDRMPDFISEHQACQNLPWLADVARLEYYCQLALHAQDDAPLALTVLAETPESELGNVILECRSSVYLMQSLWPIHQLREQGLSNDPQQVAVNENKKVYLLVFRTEMEVRVLMLEHPAYLFLEQICNSKSLAQAWETTQNTFKLDDSEFVQLLGYLLGLEIFSSRITFKK